MDMIERLKWILILALTAQFTPLASSNEKPLEDLTTVIIESQHFIDAGNPRQAIALLESGVNQYPKEHFLYTLLGEAHFESKNLDLAEDAYRKALSIDPTQALTFERLQRIREIQALLQSKTGQYKKNCQEDT